jgi:hypothetical protein
VKERRFQNFLGSATKSRRGALNRVVRATLKANRIAAIPFIDYYFLVGSSLAD